MPSNRAPRFSGLRIGLFGGTFDPPHLGHLKVAQHALDALHLDRLVWIPARVPPHKQEGARTPPETRLQMVRALLEGLSSMHVDDLELQRSGPSYTVDTLRHYRFRYPGAQLFLLIGDDWAKSFSTWHWADAIVRMATVVLVRRPPYPDVPAPAGMLRLDVPPYAISSTELRSRIMEDDFLSAHVSPRVRQIIEREGLYRY